MNESTNNPENINKKEISAALSHTPTENTQIRKTSRLAACSIICVIAAIASLILFCFFASVRVNILAGILIAVSALFVCAAFVIGSISLIVLAIRHKHLKGWACAISAVILSSTAIWTTYIISRTARARIESEKTNTGLYNLRVLGRALIAYARAHDGYLPAAEQWCDILISNNRNLTEDNFRHPKPEREQLQGNCHFAFNRNLSGLRLADIQGDTVLLFEADGDWNLNGNGELLKTMYRELGYVAMFFVNGDIKDYWFYKNAIRDYDRQGMFYKQPRWQP